jgi:hypothetical protein
LPTEVLARRKRGFSPPWRNWIRQLFDRYSCDLESGALVSHGILSPNAPTRFRSGFDRLYRMEPFAFESLTLEHWLRGLQKLEYTHDGTAEAREPDLGPVRVA